MKIKGISPHPMDSVDPRLHFFPRKVLEAVTGVLDVPIWGDGADDGVGRVLETEAALGALRGGRRKDSTETTPEGGPNSSLLPFPPVPSGVASGPPACPPAPGFSETHDVANQE